ncbi:U11/U12 small nuclear ribonucleoprotein 35 kDa protein, partial [Trichinella nativa]
LIFPILRCLLNSLSCKFEMSEKKRSSKGQRDEWKPYVEKYDPIKVGSVNGTATVAHDRALIRASGQHYKPNERVIGDPKKTLFVGRLSLDTVEADIHQLFSRYGKIARIRLVRDIVTGMSKRYAFVEFKHRRDMDIAWENAHHAIIDSSQIIVDREVERRMEGWIPRRLGGGFGGRKQSGQMRFGCRENPYRRFSTSRQTSRW